MSKTMNLKDMFGNPILYQQIQDLIEVAPSNAMPIILVVPTLQVVGMEGPTALLLSTIARQGLFLCPALSPCNKGKGLLPFWLRRLCGEVTINVGEI
jgi:hypothetical protein